MFTDPDGLQVGAVALCQRFSESPRCEPQGDQAHYRERSQLRPEDLQANPFEEDAPDDNEKISERIQISEPLDNLRHVGNREHKA